MTQQMARRRPPDLFTLFSNEVRIDVLVAPPLVTRVERYVRQPFERVRRPSPLDAEHLAMRYPYRARISWASDPERVLEMDRGEHLIEDFEVLARIPRDVVFDIAQRTVDEWLQRDERKRMRLVDYDPLSQSVTLSWSPAPPHHALAGSRRRMEGQAPPPAVLLRIRLLLDQAERSSGFEAESAFERARALADSYGVNVAALRPRSRRHLEEGAPPTERRRLPPARDRRRKPRRRHVQQ